MTKVYYVKFYQAIKIGPHLDTWLGGEMNKHKGLKMVYDDNAGLLRIKIPGIRAVSVPQANIMFFHEDEEEMQTKTKKTA